jgi:PBP1b-binding outer membrane lipoprotein LpoB
MKKFYAILALSLIVLFTACSNTSDNKTDKSVEKASVAGRWMVSKTQVITYVNDKIVDSHDDEGESNPSVIQFEANGTGSQSSMYAFVTFTYTVNKGTITFMYEPRKDKKHDIAPGPYTQDIKSIAANRMELYEDRLEDSTNGKMKIVTISTLIRLK